MRAVAFGMVLAILAPATMAVAGDRPDARLCEAYKYLTIVGLPAGDEEIRHAADAVARANCAAMLRRQSQGQRTTTVPRPDITCHNCPVHSQ
jgi:hypothetical protein